jgi:hypothetical protein
MKSQCPFCGSDRTKIECTEDELARHPDYFPCGPRSYYVGCEKCYCRGPLISAWKIGDEVAKMKAWEEFGTCFSHGFLLNKREPPKKPIVYIDLECNKWNGAEE